MSAETANSQRKKETVMQIADEIYYENRQEELATMYADYVEECRESGYDPLLYADWVKEM